MNRVVELERARADVAARKEHCAKSFHIRGFHPESIFWQAHGYHTAVQELRAAEQRLAELEAKKEVA
jgi:hypothetical protein